MGQDSPTLERQPFSTNRTATNRTPTNRTATNRTTVLALCGGVGGAKMALALVEALPDPARLTVACNTGDDFEHLGLHISPDVDSVTYRLAGLHDPERGWGRADESWHFLEALGELGGETWFQLGDRDLATHVRRSRILAGDGSLSEATAAICGSLGIPCTVAPMSDDPVRTEVLTSEGPLEFQHYFVRDRCEPAVTGFRFRGAEAATPSPALDAALRSPDLAMVVLCPSNPWVSMAPILEVPGVRDAIAALDLPRVAISPIIGGRALKGPAAKMMDELGLEVSAVSVAAHWARQGLATHFLIDPEDEHQAPRIEELGLEVLVVPARLDETGQRARLAEAVLPLAGSRAPAGTTSR